MKRFFTTFFVVLALIVSAAGVAPAAHADDIECTLNNGGTACAVDGVSGICSGDENSGPYCRVTGTADSTSFSDPAAAGTPKGFVAPESNTTESTYSWVMMKIMNLFAWLVGVAVVTLDYATYYTVVTMGNYVNNLSAVGVTWTILRDIGNIIIIFGFLAIGISIILNTEKLGYGKKMLPMLLVAAIFLNFSLFIAEAVIDTGNLFATQFYTQIKGGSLPSASYMGNTSFLKQVEQDGVSNKIMTTVGLQGIYRDALDPGKELFKPYNSWIVGFMGIILFIITAFVMFSLAFILIARFVILLFLIMVSPIGFAGLAVPKLDGLAKQWWGELFKQTLTAPVLLLLLYIALRVITDVNFLTGFGQSPSWTGFFEGKNIDGFASMILSFLVAMGLLLAVVIFSKKLSAFGGDMATKAAGALTFGATAFAGRRTVGRFSNFAARKVRSSKWGASETGRMLAGTLDRGAKASFDIRGIKAGGGLGKLNVNAGDAQKGGYQAREKELITARTDYAKSLRQSSGQKVAIENAKADHDKNMAPLEAEEQAQLATTKEIVNASREELKLKRQALEEARKSGDTDRIKTAEAAYNNDMNTHKELVESEREKLDPIRSKMETEKRRLEKVTADNSVAASQRKYGESLQKKTVLGIIPRAPYDWPTAVGSARREAGDKIIGDSKKDKSQQQMDRLEAILAKADSGGAESKSKEDKPKE